MRRRKPPWRAALLTVVAVTATGCSEGGLSPRGTEAHRIFGVFWALMIVGGAVTLFVLGAWAWAVWRGHDDEDGRAEHVPDSRLGRRFVIGGGIVMPAIVLAAFFGVQIASTMAQAQSGDLTIEVTGHRYWWEVRYDIPGIDPFTSANEIHIPTGTRVTMVLTSDDVIHSFWVPQLAGKLDMVPGRENRFVMDADEPGTYQGYCAEYCGLQHAWMKFQVVASQPDDFRTWAEQHAAPAREPTTERQIRGRDVFLGQSCVGCHSIRGVSEQSGFGPDLTHMGSRSKIGAGVLPMTTDELRGWIANPQTVKPGVQMPPQDLTDDQLDALVAYLVSLE